MAKRKRRVPATRSRPVRLSDDLWRKLSWFADAEGIQLSEAVRIKLGDALKSQRPPDSHIVLTPKGTAVQRERWEAAAKHRGQSLDDLTRDALDYVADKLLGKNP